MLPFLYECFTKVQRLVNIIMYLLITVFAPRPPDLVGTRPQRLIKNNPFYPASPFTIDNSQFTIHYSPKNCV